jgi:hypothetical protein
LGVLTAGYLAKEVCAHDWSSVITNKKLGRAIGLGGGVLRNKKKPSINPNKDTAASKR